MKDMETRDSGLIEGRNAVREALRAGIAVDKLYIARGGTDRTLGRIAAQARELGVVVAEVDRRKLDAMSATGSHQGVIAAAAAHAYATLDSILDAAREKGEPPLVGVCDEISDPHNLGAIIRTAECRSAGLTAVVEKTSAGAVSYLPVARVPNIPALLRNLKERGLWIYGADAAGESAIYDTDLRCPAALVIGSEGAGMSRLTRESCDFLLSIPMRGRISSLNASAAAAVLLYEALRQRTGQTR